MAKKKKIHIGTSGWSYPHWQGIFYPEGVKPKERLEYFSRFFNTVEINNSFYQLPSVKTFLSWKKKTGKNFLFSIKASRFITHIKRLKSVKDAWKKFLLRAKKLEEKLGPILLQFPPSFKCDDKNFKRLEIFLNYINRNLKVAFEFRHQSWYCQKVKNILIRNQKAQVIAYSSEYPNKKLITAPYIYIRMHGPEKLFSSNYNSNELKKLSAKIKKWPADEVFIYFNNDYKGYALENARFLKEELNS